MSEELAARWLEMPTTRRDSVLHAWLSQARPVDLFRVNLKRLAAEIAVDARELLSEFLYAVDAGLFVLKWEYHCPHCHAVPDFKHDFSEVKSGSFCPLCDLEFRNILDSNVEVTFTVHPGVVRMPDEILADYRERMIAAARAGSYPMPEVYLSGLECLNNATFRELFSEQVPSVEESLEIRRLALLFTDIQGSTAMYSSLGDVRSYHIVRQHFKILFQAVTDHQGLVVKTIGDAILASFLTPADAFAAALRAQHEFQQYFVDPVGYLAIKMGIHTGGAIAVNLNDRVDYFGNTVNIAARIESVAGGRNIAFSRAVFDDRRIQEILRENKKQLEGGAVRKRLVQLKGVAGDFELYSVSLAGGPAPQNDQQPGDTG